MTIAMPDLELYEFLDIQEQCQHSEHPKRSYYHDDGPATYWFEFLCPECKNVTRGYRCEKWSQTVILFDKIWCNQHCGKMVDARGNMHFTRLHGAA